MDWADGVLILPMRDWNFDRGACTSSPFSFWSYLWGIETICTLYLWNVVHSFDLTYEGLKSVSGNSNWRSHVWVLILPMRDWNEDFGIFIAGELAVLILPMRNCWLKAWFFVLYHSQLYKSPDKIPFIYFLKFFAFFPLFFLTFLCKISIISIFVLNFYKIIKFMKDSEKMCQSY